MFTKDIFMSKRNNRNCNVKAFSMIETITAMAVTAIIIGIVFTIFSIMSEMLLQFKIQNEGIADLNRFTYSVNKDIFESESMAVGDSLMSFSDYNGSLCNYLIGEEHVLRQNEVYTDTFKIKINHLKIDTLASKELRKVYRNLKVGLNVNGQKINLSFYKKVYANELMVAKQ